MGSYPYNGLLVAGCASAKVARRTPQKSAALAMLSGASRLKLTMRCVVKGSATHATGWQRRLTVEHLAD
eukprot:scaffold633888_cov17-Prasinocladus_malaysianus.AAC.1